MQYYFLMMNAVYVWIIFIVVLLALSKSKQTGQGLKKTLVSQFKELSVMLTMLTFGMICDWIVPFVK